MSWRQGERPSRRQWAKVQPGQFRTVWDVVEWVQGRWGVTYTYNAACIP